MDEVEGNYYVVELWPKILDVKLWGMSIRTFSC